MIPDEIPATPAPTPEQVELIRGRVDPNGMLLEAKVESRMRARDGNRSRDAFVFPRPLGASRLVGFPTQGSASLHPWATILRRFAAQWLYRK